MMRDYKALLEPLTRLRGVRGAMVVAADDGVVVVDALMDGMKGKALAALAAALASRIVDLELPGPRSAPPGSSSCRRRKAACCWSPRRRSCSW